MKSGQSVIEMVTSSVVSSIFHLVNFLSPLAIVRPPFASDQPGEFVGLLCNLLASFSSSACAA